MAIYQINKGINKPIEFKGLKAQYISFLAIGLVILLLLFTLMYLLGLPVTWCLPVTGSLGGLLFQQVYRLSNRYGEFGLMKRSAKRYLPGYLKFRSRHLFISKKQ
jgi:4-hydroxybenzoate polyprenyltransferase